MIKSYIVIVIFLFCSCNKEWLDERSDRSVTTPSTIEDLRALADNTSIFNGNSGASFGIPEFAEIGTDNHYMSESTFDQFQLFLKHQTNAYIFATDVFEGINNINLWNIPYKRIFTANIILENAQGLNQDHPEVKQLRGEAFFHRAHALFWLAQIFMKPYDASAADQELGLPLRLTADPNVPTKRATMLATYDQIISDLQAAVELLPPLPAFASRPSAASAHGLLARVYLLMNNFQNAMGHATSSLDMASELVDFNTLVPSSPYPIPQYNSEVLFSDITPTSLFYEFFCNVDSALYNSYDDHDLRKTIFFKNKGDNVFSFNGGYDGTSYIFGGIAVDEVLLTRAEAYARLGTTDSAKIDLNKLLKKRFVSGQFQPVTEANPNNLLEIILTERRKELCFRGFRWLDLRRLNQLSANITVTHIMKGTVYTLSADDTRWTYPIPPDVINLTGIEQNSR